MSKRQRVNNRNRGRTEADRLEKIRKALDRKQAKQAAQQLQPVSR